MNSKHMLLYYSQMTSRQEQFGNIQQKASSCLAACACPQVKPTVWKLAFVLCRTVFWEGDQGRASSSLEVKLHHDSFILYGVG
mmetsp:Transcript_21794/g.31569  ORF Transcript_21794/g.31569 Transcript_21794/m.31569 type:complete len:83 (+) Transcript_21794:1611-1859(+)